MCSRVIQKFCTTFSKCLDQYSVIYVLLTTSLTNYVHYFTEAAVIHDREIY